MKKALLWIGGVALVAASLLGLMFAIAGLVAVGQVAGNATKFATETLMAIDQSLTATADGLLVVDQSLDSVDTTIRTLSGTLSSTSATVGQSLPLIDNVAGIVGKDVVNVIKTTQVSLVSAKNSAAGIDSALNTLANIPLLNLGSIKPEVPLETSLGNIVTSLDPLSGNLTNVANGLAATKSNVADVQKNLDALTRNIGPIYASLKAGKSVIAQYRKVVADLRAQIGILVKGLPEWLQAARIGLSLLLIWLGIAQIGLFAEGLELVARARRVGKP
jgi:molybdopterin-binding protein